jgi:CDP-diacylglycerol--glycerol-3-phosphate 3-phosphatidyltransferase
MNLPNKLTLLRIALVPVFLVFAAPVPDALFAFFGLFGYDETLRGYAAFLSDGGGHIVAGVIFLLAFLTDALDGYIARKWNLVTDFGKFLDPIADKLLVTAALIALTAWGQLDAWIPVIIISREFIVTGLRLLAANRGIVLAAGGLGKLKTVAQTAALTLFLFRNFSLGPLEAIHADAVLMYAALVLTVISGLDYLIRNKALLRL